MKLHHFLVQAISAINRIKENNKWILLKNFKYVFFFFGFSLTSQFFMAIICK